MGVITTGSLFTSSKLTGTGGNHINLGLRSWASSGFLLPVQYVCQVMLPTY